MRLPELLHAPRVSLVRLAFVVLALASALLAAGSITTRPSDLLTRRRAQGLR